MRTATWPCPPSIASRTSRRATCGPAMAALGGMAWSRPWSTRGGSVAADLFRLPPWPSAIERWHDVSMETFSGRVAAITGAGSGIGRALARELARRGALLALSGGSQTGLAETGALCEGNGVKVTSHRVDVADRAA